MSDQAVGADPGRNAGELRILIVDDHEVLRTGTRQVLEASGDIVVVGEADDGNAALAMIDELDPNVVLIDIRLPDRSGIDVARHVTLTHPHVRVVILSAYDDDEFVRAALDAGATGYLLKTMARDELVAAVRVAAQGITVLDPSLSPRLAGTHSSWGPGGAPRLTWREREAVELVAEGLSNKAIAARLGVSVRTVEGHLNHVFTKLGVESRTELVRYVLTQGLIASTPSGESRP
ncbi:MAG TPA: response regulator transcription factor [Acidimicrobiales bacterium]